MKIADLKQPYRRMAEYLAEKETDKHFKNKNFLYTAFNWLDTNVDFWHDIYHGEYPPITKEIKQHFPADFDFSEKEIENISINEKYTQLAREGKFDQLPDTCEFSEPVELEVWDYVKEGENVKTNVLGKFKSRYIDEDFYLKILDFYGWQYAKLPTPKIDFSQFKSGDVLEITNKDNEKYYGLLYLQTINELVITLGYNSKSSKHILKDNILSITKIK